MDVQLPDGTLLRGVPDGTSKADLTLKLKANGYDTSKLDAPAAPAAPGFNDLPIAGLGGITPRQGRDAALGMVRGAGSIGATLMVPVDAAARAMGVSNDYIGRTDRRESLNPALQEMGADPNSLAFKGGKLGAEAAGTAGAGGLLGKAAAPILSKIAPEVGPQIVNALRTNGFSTGAPVASGLAGTASNLAIRGGAGAVAGGAQVGLASPENAGTGALIGGALPGSLKALGAIGGAVANKFAGAPLTAGRQAAVNSAREAGLVLPPTEINPNALNSAVEGLSGKIKTAQAASFKNQPVINKMAATELGLDPAEPITSQALQAVRNTAGKAYEALKNTGRVVADSDFGKALDKIVEKYKGAADDFPELAKSDVTDLIDKIRKPDFSSKGAVDAIGILREKSNEAFGQGNKALGKAAKLAADEMENLMGRHLEATGADPALVQAFQDARQTIAKTYSVGKALNVSDGNVSAIKLGQQLAKGAPLSGGLKTAGEAGLAFKESLQPLTRNPNALSPLDYFAGIQNAKSSVGAALAGLAARPLARGAILSEPFQKFAAKGAPNVNALAGPAIYRALPRAGQNGP